MRCRNGNQDDLIPRLLSTVEHCRKAKDLSLAQSIYKQIHWHGLENDIVLGNRLVQLFVACGCIPDAQKAFDSLERRNVLSWTALISGHVSYGPVNHAFHIYHQMLEDGVLPSSYTIVALLQACIKLNNSTKLQEIHIESIDKGFERDPFVASALVSTYSKFGLVQQAQECFDKVAHCDAVLWNTLISCYAEHGTVHEALRCYEQMLTKNVCPTAVTYLSLLKACIKSGFIEKGQQLHSEITQKAIENDLLVNSTLIDMYVKFGFIADAETNFFLSPFRSTAAWNTIISGYIEEGRVDEAINQFKEMQSKGFPPDDITFVYGLKACGIAGNIEKGKEMHCEILCKGLEKDHFLGSTIVDMYGKCGAVFQARQVFDKFEARDVVSWTALISGYVFCGYKKEALELYYEMYLDSVSPNDVTFACILESCDTHFQGLKIHKEIVIESYELYFLVSSSLVGMYVRLGLIPEAQDVFDSLQKPDLVLWNTLLAGYAEYGPYHHILSCLQQIQLENLSPDAVTLSSVLKCCANLKDVERGQETHVQVIAKGYENDMIVQCGLVEMYGKCNCILEANGIFDKLLFKDVVSWNALIAGFSETERNQNVLDCLTWMNQENVSADPWTYSAILKACGSMGALEDGKRIHAEVLKKGYDTEPFVGSSLIGLYVKCGANQEGWDVFIKLAIRDYVTWNTLITGYSDKENAQEALTCFDMMLSERFSASSPTFISVLKACGQANAIEKLHEIHIGILQKGLEGDIQVGNCIVDTYARCGCLGEAQKLFGDLLVKDVASYNSMIKGFGMNHQSSVALQYFRDMLRVGIKPDETTFTCLITTCSRTSLLAEAHNLFEIMINKFGIMPNTDHLVCVIDLFARAGCLYEAEKLTKTIPCSPSKNALTILLSASKTHEEQHLGLSCFEKLLHDL